MPKRRRKDADVFDQNLTVRISSEIREEIDQVSDDKGWSIGLVVREAIKAGLPIVAQSTDEDSQGD